MCLVCPVKQVIRGGADKSLDWPWRKQATATKLGIYSAYSPRSSIHFSARCSNFCKPLKKNSEVVRPTRSLRQQWLPRRTKNCDLSVVFSVQGTGGSPTGPGLENRVGDQDTGNPGSPVSSGSQVPSEMGHCCARTRPLDDLSMVFFLQNILQLHQQRWVVLHIDSLALWKIINEEDVVLISENWGEKFSSRFLHTELFGVGWEAMPPLHWLLLCLRVIAI